MTALLLLLIIAAIALGIVGVVAKGPLYLRIIGIVVFLGALRMRRRPGRHPGRQPPGQSLAGVAADGQVGRGRRTAGRAFMELFWIPPASPPTSLTQYQPSGVASSR